MLAHFPILSFLIWWPILGAILIVTAGRSVHTLFARCVAVVVTLVELLMCMQLYARFNFSSFTMQFQEHVAWIPQYQINYSLGVDGISLVMIMLTTLTNFVVVMAGCKLVRKNIPHYMAVFLVAQAMMVGVFASLDAILFYVFWEAMLIPIYICIGMWGGKNRSYAAVKFFLYTFLGSVLMLIAILYLHKVTHSFKIADFYDAKLIGLPEVLVFFGFFAAFAVKVPLWPFHTWLPDAHTEAPAGGSVILAALMLKLGVYGFVRFSMPITPTSNQQFDVLMIVLALIAIVYIGILALAQTDIKKLIAYSSIAHMGFAVLGCYMVYDIMRVTGSYADAYLSMEGAVVQMVSHAFSTGGLFLAAGILQYRIGSRMIKDYGGVAKSMPIFSAFVMLFAMANVGLPGTSGFVGEFMVIISAFQANFLVAFLAATTLIIAAGYTLWMYKRVFFGAVVHERVASMQDIGFIEILVFIVLSFFILFIGLYPQWLLNILHAPVGHLLRDSLQFNPHSIGGV